MNLAATDMIKLVGKRVINIWRKVNMVSEQRVLTMIKTFYDKCQTKISVKI